MKQLKLVMHVKVSNLILMLIVKCMFKFLLWFTGTEISLFLLRYFKRLSKFLKIFTRIYSSVYFLLSRSCAEQLRISSNRNKHIVRFPEFYIQKTSRKYGKPYLLCNIMSQVDSITIHSRKCYDLFRTCILHAHWNASNNIWFMFVARQKNSF